MKELNLKMESCWQCPYLRFDEEEIEIEGWYCKHPDTENYLILEFDSEDIFNGSGRKFGSLYPSGFPTVCRLEDVKEI